MWQISDTIWLNPLVIASVYDDPTRSEVRVRYVGENESIAYSGPERQAVLAHLARTSQPQPPTEEEHRRAEQAYWDRQAEDASRRRHETPPGDSPF